MFRRDLKTRFRHLLWCSDLEATRFTLAMGAITWAILLAWPGHLFPEQYEVAMGKGRLTYAIMAQMFDENVWACLWAFQGGLMLFSLATGVRSCLLMILDAMLGVFLWTVCVGSAFIVYWPKMYFLDAALNYNPPAAMAGEVWLVMASWWVLVRYKCGKKNDRSHCQ